MPEFSIIPKISLSSKNKAISDSIELLKNRVILSSGKDATLNISFSFSKSSYSKDILFKADLYRNKIYFTKLALKNMAGSILYALKTVLPITLQPRSILSLHASAVGKGNRSILIVGNRGSGKSILTFKLVEKDCLFLGDDMVHCYLKGSKLFCWSYEKGVRLLQGSKPCSYFMPPETESPKDFYKLRDSISRLAQVKAIVFPRAVYSLKKAFVGKLEPTSSLKRIIDSAYIARNASFPEDLLSVVSHICAFLPSYYLEFNPSINIDNTGIFDI